MELTFDTRTATEYDLQILLPYQIMSIFSFLRHYFFP